ACDAIIGEPPTPGSGSASASQPPTVSGTSGSSEDGPPTSIPIDASPAAGLELSTSQSKSTIRISDKPSAYLQASHIISSVPPASKQQLSIASVGGTARQYLGNATAAPVYGLPRKISIAGTDSRIPRAELR